MKSVLAAKKKLTLRSANKSVNLTNYPHRAKECKTLVSIKLT